MPANRSPSLRLQRHTQDQSPGQTSHKAALVRSSVSGGNPSLSSSSSKFMYAWDNRPLNSSLITGFPVAGWMKNIFIWTPKLRSHSSRAVLQVIQIDIVDVFYPWNCRSYPFNDDSHRALLFFRASTSDRDAIRRCRSLGGQRGRGECTSGPLATFAHPGSSQVRRDTTNRAGSMNRSSGGCPRSGWRYWLFRIGIGHCSHRETRLRVIACIELPRVASVTTGHVPEETAETRDSTSRR